MPGSLLYGDIRRIERQTKENSIVNIGQVKKKLREISLFNSKQMKFLNLYVTKKKLNLVRKKTFTFTPCNDQDY